MPFAEPINPEPQNFQELIMTTGKLFGISNISIVSEPEWEYVLPFGGSGD